MVRLKVVSIESGKGSVVAISIPYGSIKSFGKKKQLRMNLISIPYGSIKSWTVG